MKRGAQDWGRYFQHILQYLTKSIFKIYYESSYLSKKVNKPIKSGQKLEQSLNKYSSGQSAQEKMVNIIIHQRIQMKSQ